MSNGKPNAQEVLKTFDRQEISWIESTVQKMRQVKAIAQSIKLHLVKAGESTDLNEVRSEFKTALEFEQLLEMIANEDIRAGEEQLRNN